jgi:general secretion pathway protein G
VADKQKEGGFMKKTEILSRAGFTLIEIMVVVMIISMLAGIVGYTVIGRIDDAKMSATKNQIANLEGALKLYKLDNGDYPDTQQGLKALVEKPSTGKSPGKWKKYLEKETVPKDPWGNEYVYISPGTHGEYDMLSYGADGEPGGEGKNKDITSWESE